MNMWPETMPWDEIDTVVFDVGNVLLRWNPPELAAMLFPEDQEKQRIAVERAYTSPLWPEIDLGKKPLEQIEREMVEEDTAIAPVIHQAIYDWPTKLPAIPSGVAALHACKQHGKKTCVLSNYGGDFFYQSAAVHPFFKLFDDMVISGVEKVCKPDPAIYHLVEQRMGSIPERTLFLDDTLRNVEAAVALGWRGLHATDERRVETFFGVQG